MGTWIPAEWTKKKKVTPEGPGALVYSRFDLSAEYAEDSFAIATEFIRQLEALLAGFEPPGIDDIENVKIPDLEPLSYDNRPAIGTLELPKIPDSTVIAPPWASAPSFDSVEFPHFDEDSPEYIDPDKPDPDTISAPGDPQDISPIEYPAKPDINIPSVPSLEDIIFPSAPTITIPEFDSQVPTETWDMPQNFSYTEADYGSDIWADLLAKVLNDIRNGGTGLGALVEKELYDRALARQETENERLYQEVEDYFEVRGFSLPPGAMAGRLAETAREISRNNTEINSKIMIDQAQLAQTNTHFMVEKGIQLEGMLRDFFNAQAARTFEAAKTIAQVGVEIFNANVNKFNANVQRYQAEAAVFESRVKAALTQAEIYKTQIDACGVMSDVQKNLVAIYSEKVKALDTIIKLYSTEMDAARIKSEVEKNKIEIFRLQVQVYVARIEANKAKFEVYIKELEGEKVKAAVYTEQVRGYLGEVEAAKAESDMNIQSCDIVLKENQIRSEQYKAELEGYNVIVRTLMSKIASKVEGFKAEATTYGVETEAEGSWFRAKVEEMRVGVEKAKTELAKAIGEMDASVKGFEAVKKLQVEGTSGIMNTASVLCAATMNAVNATATVGYTGHESSTETWGHNESITESHPYEDQAG